MFLCVEMKCHYHGVFLTVIECNSEKAGGNVSVHVQQISA